jgi:chromate reductase
MESSMPNDAPLKILGICGSLRRESFNAALLNALPELCPPDMTIEAYGRLRDFPLYNQDDQQVGFPAAARALADAIRRSDGVIIVSPEYNFSVPGVLKNAVDWVSRVPDQPFKNKPVLLQSASVGPLGGARVQYHLRQILVFLDAIVFTRPEIFVGSAATRFEGGALTDETTRNLIRQQLAGFAEFARRVTP